ncbi:MAG: hypothetical protein NUV96_00560 [Candidatus Colwellbacteria bacterium]|nr:hypothetical protein [Candidatus Colwellbacteria bacterium]
MGIISSLRKATMYPRMSRLVEVTDLPSGKSYFEANLYYPLGDERMEIEVPCRQVRFACDPQGIIHARITDDTPQHPEVGQHVWIYFEGTSLVGWGTTESFSKALDWCRLTVEERRQAFGLTAEPRGDRATTPA